MKDTLNTQKNLPTIRESLCKIASLTLRILAQRLKRFLIRLMQSFPSILAQIGEGFLIVLKGLVMGLGIFARTLVILLLKTGEWLCENLGKMQVHPNLLIPFSYGILAFTLTLALAYLPDLFSHFKVFDFYFFKLTLNQTFGFSFVILLLALLITTQNKGLGQLEWFSENQIEHFPKSNWLNSTGIKLFHGYSAILMGMGAGVVLAIIRMLFL